MIAYVHICTIYIYTVYVYIYIYCVCLASCSSSPSHTRSNIRACKQSWDLKVFEATFAAPRVISLCVGTKVLMWGHQGKESKRVSQSAVRVSLLRFHEIKFIPVIPSAQLFLPLMLSSRSLKQIRYKAFHNNPQHIFNILCNIITSLLWKALHSTGLVIVGAIFCRTKKGKAKPSAKGNLSDSDSESSSRQSARTPGQELRDVVRHRKREMWQVKIVQGETIRHYKTCHTTTWNNYIVEPINLRCFRGLLQPTPSLT